MTIARPIAIFDSTFDEALELSREVRDYLTFHKQGDFAQLTALGRLVAGCESMRMTARITQVVAWLLVQKAVHKGELSRLEASQPEYRLAGGATCETGELVAQVPLPERLVDLLERTRQLYLRVARLDAMLDRPPSRSPDGRQGR